MTPELVAELRELLDDVKLWPNSESRRFGLYRAAVNALPELLAELERLQGELGAICFYLDEASFKIERDRLQAENSRLRAALEDIGPDCGYDDPEQVVEDLQEIARRALEKGGE